MADHPSPVGKRPRRRTAIIMVMAASGALAVALLVFGLASG
jgi:hypothetical protein